jgi:hypothetical protein
MATSNYNTISDLHTLRTTTAHAKSYQSAVCSPAILWNWHLTVEILQFPCSLHCPLALSCTNEVFSSQTPLQLWQTSKPIPVITSRHGPHRKHGSLLYSNHFRGTCLFVKELLSNGCVYLLIMNLLHSTTHCLLLVLRSVLSNRPTHYSISTQFDCEH